MSKAAELLDTLRLDGFTVAARDGKVLVSPKTKLTPELAAVIREHKADLLELLTPPRPVSPLETFLTGHWPTTGCAVVIDKGGGRFVAVPLAEYQRLTETLP